MRGISVFLYSVEQGFKSLKKNKLFTLASTSTMAACLFLFGMFFFIILNFGHMIQKMETSVGLAVFFDSGINQTQSDSIGEAIKVIKDVDHIEYISADEAWETFKADNFDDDPELIESFGEDNPLSESASFHVFIKDIAAQENVATQIEKIEGVREVKRSNEAAKSLESANRIITYIGITIIAILMAVSVFLINSTISTGITVRREEIAILRLMGASDFFIRAPFIVEGVVIGFVGALIPIIILRLSYGAIVVFVEDKFKSIGAMLSFLPAGDVFIKLVPLCFVIGIGVGFLGSFFTVRKHLDV